MQKNVNRYSIGYEAKHRWIIYVDKFTINCFQKCAEYLYIYTIFVCLCACLVFKAYARNSHHDKSWTSSIRFKYREFFQNSYTFKWINTNKAIRKFDQNTSMIVVNTPTENMNFQWRKSQARNIWFGMHACDVNESCS